MIKTPIEPQFVNFNTFLENRSTRTFYPMQLPVIKKKKNNIIFEIRVKEKKSSSLHPQERSATILGNPSETFPDDNFLAMGGTLFVFELNVKNV